MAFLKSKILATPQNSQLLDNVATAIAAVHNRQQEHEKNADGLRESAARLLTEANEQSAAGVTLVNSLKEILSA